MDSPVPSRRYYLALAAVIVLTFMAIAPTLRWLEFSSGSENLNVGTALEIRRENRWLLPSLAGEAQYAKPPLTASDHGGGDPVEHVSRCVRQPRRDARIGQGALAGGNPMAVPALIVRDAADVPGAGARAVRRRTVRCRDRGGGVRDEPLLPPPRTIGDDGRAARAVGRGGECFPGPYGHAKPPLARRAAGAGLALGLAFMSKGPVALVQSASAVRRIVIWEAIAARRDATRTSSTTVASDASTPGDQDVLPRNPMYLESRGNVISSAAVDRNHAVARSGQSTEMRFGQIALPVALFVLVALPSYALVAAKNPDVWARWQMEVARKGTTDLPPGKWYAYVSFFAFMMPWTAFLIAGIAVVVRDVVQTPARGAFAHASEAASSPSPGTPGEGWGEGSRGRRAIPIDVNRAEPSPCPLPEYRARGMRARPLRATATRARRHGAGADDGRRADRDHVVLPRSEGAIPAADDRAWRGHHRAGGH